ncbi:MAG: two-component regulator propeller domain-containing protein, partial [Blastocatellia bacterium]
DSVVVVMSRVRISGAILILLSSPVFWRGRATSEIKGYDRERIAGHKLLRIHHSSEGNDGSRDLALPVVLFQDPLGIYWVGTITRLYSFDEGTIRWTSSTDASGKSPGRSARTIAWSADGKLWVRSMVLRYLSVFEGDRWRKVETIHGFKVEPSAPLLASKSGIIWLAQKAGVYRYDKGKWQGPIGPPASVEHLFNVYSNEKSFDSIAASKKETIIRFVSVGIEDRDGDLWMGTRSMVLRFSPNNREWTVYRLPTRLQGVFGIYEDAIGHIWFCDTTGGVAEFDKANSLWAVHDLLQVLRRNRQQFPYSEFYVNGICQDSSGQVLFGTDVGLIAFKAKNDEWNVYTSDNSGLPDNKVSALLVDRTRKIWIGTGKGIVVLDPSG